MDLSVHLSGTAIWHRYLCTYLAPGPSLLLPQDLPMDSVFLCDPSCFTFWSGYGIQKWPALSQVNNTNINLNLFLGQRTTRYSRPRQHLPPLEQQGRSHPIPPTEHDLGRDRAST